VVNVVQHSKKKKKKKNIFGKGTIPKKKKNKKRWSKQDEPKDKILIEGTLMA